MTDERIEEKLSHKTVLTLLKQMVLTEDVMYRRCICGGNGGIDANTFMGFSGDVTGKKYP